MGFLCPGDLSDPFQSTTFGKAGKSCALSKTTIRGK
jgi:hypothetical protein